MNRALLVLLTAGLVLLAGCGGGNGPAVEAPPSSAAAAGFNAADVMFLQMMVPHLGQGVEMVRLVKDRTAREEVKVLAAAIEVTQVAEADTMSGLLRDWKQPATMDASPDAHAHHGGTHETSPDTIAMLAAATDDFEAKFLNLLTGHQHNAVEMAKAETTGGVNPQVKEFADRIVRSRTAEISQMLAFLGK
ncbi:MAG: hypothetical protein QOI21_1090 [Actinomycetota bacterium]|jgi:uncharacterized protein (DUF305 family)|nr:hypothetical protein [Actinomycetota bacterium]